MIRSTLAAAPRMAAERNLVAITQSAGPIWMPRAEVAAAGSAVF
jgi:hypothetical protein